MNPDAPHASSSPIDLTPARVAREVYDAAVTAPNVTPLTWAGIAVEMQRTAELLKLAGSLRGIVECHEARARDAAARAVTAALMVRDAQTRRVIGMATIGGAS